MNGMPSLRRRAVPSALTNPESEINRLITATGDLDTRDPDRRLFAAKTQQMVLRDCSSYRVSRIDDVLCRSGEDTGQAFRGASCAQCHVGQFSKNMVFVGQITLAPRRPQPQL